MVLEQLTLLLSLLVSPSWAGIAPAVGYLLTRSKQTNAAAKLLESNSSMQ